MDLSDFPACPFIQFGYLEFPQLPHVNAGSFLRLCLRYIHIHMLGDYRAGHSLTVRPSWHCSLAGA